ncbi:uncharacterized protein LOC116180104 [Photinus pyralis]|uniref:uncharacterized protein LOC116180104 n=1 Tax=Photinus pyralis TaxID=7054 RepID=UPI001267251F|nr:uncharacterized protein LOC116180104 [Photinus pyralis]
MAGQLGRLMCRTGGPREWKWRVLVSVVDNVILYGCEVWGKAIKTRRAREMVDRVQRKIALRIATAYRTVSTKDLFVVASTPPLRLKIWARHEGKSKADILEAWEEEWQIRESWAKEVIGNLKSWGMGGVPEKDKKEGE